MSELKKPLLLMSLAAILLALPELTWTQYPYGISPDPDVITFENIIDGIFYTLGILVGLKACWYFKETSPPE
jgi:hypothetical protein